MGPIRTNLTTLTVALVLAAASASAASAAALGGSAHADRIVTSIGIGSRILGGSIGDGPAVAECQAFAHDAGQAAQPVAQDLLDGHEGQRAAGRRPPG